MHEPGPLRPDPLPLLALRPGRLARPGALGRAAGAHRAHPREGEERAAGRGRHPRAAGPGHRRGAGRRAGRPARRLHRRGGRASCSASTAPTAQQVVTVPPGVDLEVFRPAEDGHPGPAGRGPRATRARPRTRWCCCSSAASSRSRPRTCCCAPPPCCSSGTRRCARRLVVAVVGGPSGTGLRAPEHLQKLAGELGITDVVRFAPPAPAGASSPTGTAPPTSARSPPTTSPSGWSRSRPRPAAPRSSPPPSAGCATAVRDGVSGVLVDGHDPADWAREIGGLLADPAAAARALRAARSRTPASSAGAPPPTGCSRPTPAPSPSGGRTWPPCADALPVLRHRVGAA